MKKAIVFTTDVIIAATVAATMLLGVSYMFRGPELGLSSAVTLRQTAEDALTAMDKQGILKNTILQSDAAAQASVSAFLNAALPPHIAANITVDVFEYTPSGACSSSCRLDGNSAYASFCACRRFSANTSELCAAPNATAGACLARAQARRMFYAFIQADRAGRAVMDLWVKSN